MTPYYQYLIDGKFGLNLVVYSGDDDDVCPTVGTQGWIWDLGYEVAGRAWQDYTVDGQTAGYITKWKDTGFAFATVRGAGHEVSCCCCYDVLLLLLLLLSGGNVVLLAKRNAGTSTHVLSSITWKYTHLEFIERVLVVRILRISIGRFDCCTYIRMPM